MKKLSSINFIAILLILPGMMLCLEASSQKKKAETLPKGAVKLTYKYSESVPVKYLSTAKVVQTMDINGQSMEVNVASLLECNVNSKGNSGSNLALVISIDSMSQSIDSPQGSMGGPITEVKGKSFSMVITPAGKEIDLKEAKDLVINIEGSGQTDASQSFADFFPDLPEVAITPGYTWSTTDTVKSQSTVNSITMIVKSDNKFEGFEIVDGLNCVKITSILSGTRNQNTQSQGMDITTKGDFTGTGMLYFLPEDGYFVKQAVNTKLTGTIDITTPDVMTFPLIMDINMVNEVVK